MGYFLIITTTIIVVGILLFRDLKGKLKDGIKFFALLKEINNAYINIFKRKILIKVLIDSILIGAAGIFSFISISITINKYFKVTGNIFVDVTIKVVVSILIFIVLYYVIGYFLLFTAKIQSFIRKTEDKNFRVDFIISYFIITTYLTTMVLFSHEFKKLGWILLVGVVISYYLNITMMIRIMMNPYNVKSMKQENISFSRIIAAAILLLCMLIIDLFLFVVVVDAITPGAFSNIDGTFSMLYYTVITFTTIGYGDIVPITVGARLVAMLISVTSVICITIFLSSVLSYREKFTSK